MRKFRRQHRSPLYQVAEALKDIPMEELEVIKPYTLAPWEKRVQTMTDGAPRGPNAAWAVRIAVSSSSRNGVVGMGGAIEIHKSAQSTPGNGTVTFSSTLGKREEQNPYSGELAAMAKALGTLPKIRFCNIVLTTRNKGAVLALRRPRQQSGQENISRIYRSIGDLKREGNKITILWLPASEKCDVAKLAKQLAKMATRPGTMPQQRLPRMRSTTLNAARKHCVVRKLPDTVGRYSKAIDTALPGKHTRRLYDGLSRKEASVLAQLRTGIARLNSFLHRIGVANTDQCDCGHARETVNHFLFRCRRWTTHRREMLQCTDTGRGNMSLYLGGQAPTDDATWAPDMNAVRATIRFAISTGRLDAN